MNPYFISGNPYMPQKTQNNSSPLTLRSIMELLMQIDAMRGQMPQGTAGSPQGGNFAGGASAFPQALGGLGMFQGGGSGGAY